MRFDGLMDQDLADFSSLLPEFSSSDRNLTVSQGKNINPGFYKDNTVHGKYVLYSDVWLYTTHGIKTWSDLTVCQAWLGSLFLLFFFYTLLAFFALQNPFQLHTCLQLNIFFRILLKQYKNKNEVAIWLEQTNLYFSHPSSTLLRQVSNGNGLTVKSRNS